MNDVEICREVQSDISICAARLAPLLYEDSELAERLQDEIRDSFNKLLDAKNHLNRVVN